MNRICKALCIALVYIFVLGGVLFAVLWGSKTITTVSEGAPIVRQNCVIIDAGHGGVDGGAVSCTGVYEKEINLSIALRLNDLMHLIGIHTEMIRTTDISVYTSGSSIAAKKSSDLKERVRIVNETDNAILLSIHQNHYTDSRYSGAQMFYAKTDGSRELAQMLQQEFSRALDPDNNRQIKKAAGLYLMEHVQKPAVLVECGFLSNPSEEALLRTAEYQKKICCVVASACSIYFAKGKDAT